MTTKATNFVELSEQDFYEIPCSPVCIHCIRVIDKEDKRNLFWVPVSDHLYDFISPEDVVCTPDDSPSIIERLSILIMSIGDAVVPTAKFEAINQFFCAMPYPG